MKAITIAAEQAKLLKKANDLLGMWMRPDDGKVDRFDETKLFQIEVEELEKHKKDAIIDALWEGVKGLNREPENDFEAHYRLEINIIPAVKAWRLITGDDLKTSADAVKAIREEIYNGTIKFPFI